MQKITPTLWCKRNAKEAVAFYLSVFPRGKIVYTSYYPTKGLLDFQKEFAGKELAIYVELLGYQFVAINAGDEFTPTPSNSFLVNVDSSREQNAREMLSMMWEKLAAGGRVLMPLQQYDFSKLYGWIEDKYGFSWQLMLTDPNGEPRTPILPFLMFTGSKPQAEEAIRFYRGVFKNSNIGQIHRYDPAAMPNMKDMVLFADFTLEGEWFAAIDGGDTHDFSFNEAVSYNIACKDQAEIDYYWEKLTANGGEESVCGWCKDKYGVSWQINPENIEELLRLPGAWERLLQMKKIDIATLQNTHGGNEVFHKEKPHRSF